MWCSFFILNIDIDQANRVIETIKERKREWYWIVKRDVKEKKEGVVTSF